jgi:hypothetical protein
MDNFGLSTPSINLQGDFNTYEPDKPIADHLWGQLPQLNWYNRKACSPVAFTNALAGMAAAYEIPALLKNGKDHHLSLLETFLSLAKEMQTTIGGTSSRNAARGINSYFKAQGVSKHFSATRTGVLDENKKPHRNLNLFPDLISAFAKGPVIFSDTYKKGPGGHALTGIKLEINDRNNNMIIDKGEAYALVIDPLNPSQNYSPNSIDRSGLSDDDAEDLWNTTIKAAPNALPFLQRVEIYQVGNHHKHPGALAFNYNQSSIVDPTKGNTWEVNIKTRSGKTKGYLYNFTGLEYSELGDNLNASIAPIESDQVIFDFSSFVKDNKVSAELFSYFNESSDFANELSFYQLVDDQGTVIDPVSGAQLTPGADGYRKAALKQAEIFEASDRVSTDDDLDGRISQDAAQMGSFSFELEAINGTALFAPIVTTSDGVVWTTFAEANQDGLDHFQWQGGLSFKMEDQPGLGDRDFNDLQVVLTPLEINGIS